MDALKNIPACLIDNIDSLHLADLTDDERILLINYVALTRDVTEANQLFESFYFNLLSLRNSFLLKMNDTIERTNNCPNNTSDFIALNSLVINLISSAKTLTEFLRDSADLWLGNNEKTKEKYKDEYNVYVSKIYDSSFNYRLLINLRNYVQHGYLPISFNEDRYGFDIAQILDSPHFEIKGQLKIDMENFIKKCEIPGENIACVSLTVTIADFVVRVIDILKKFLFFIKKIISLMHNEVKKLIQIKPSIVCNYHEAFKGYILYDMDECRYHAFNLNENPNRMMNTYEKNVSYIYKVEKQYFDDLYNHLTIHTDIKF